MSPVSGHTESGAREIRCHANRGKEYAVSFNAKDEVQSVRVRVWTGPLNPSLARSYWRMVWNLSYGEMTTTAACAVRAALEKLKTRPIKPCVRGNDECPEDCCTHLTDETVAKP